MKYADKVRAILGLLEQLGTTVDEDLTTVHRRHIAADDALPNEVALQQLRALSDEAWKAHTALAGRGMDAARGLDRAGS